jgi:hypothetical protein
MDVATLWNHVSDASSNQFTYSSHVLIVELGFIL